MDSVSQGVAWERTIVNPALDREHAKIARLFFPRLTAFSYLRPKAIAKQWTEWDIIAKTLKAFRAPLEPSCGASRIEPLPSKINSARTAPPLRLSARIAGRSPCRAKACLGVTSCRL